MVQKGYRWPGWSLYHGTAATDTILEHGFQTRAQLAEVAAAREEHMVGGGTAHAVSMTLDVRVARSILIGLKVMSRLVKGTMKLGDLVIAGMEQAPVGMQAVIDEYRLTPERIAMYDQDLLPFYVRYLGGDPESELDAVHDQSVVRHVEKDPGEIRPAFGDEVQAVPPEAVEVTAVRFTGAQSPFQAYGWAPMEAVTRQQKYGIKDPWNHPWLIGMYKMLLAYADNVYNPLFFLTNLDAMQRLDEDQLGILITKCDAEWLCIDPFSAERLGLPDKKLGSYGHDWNRSCHQHLDDLMQGRDWPYRGVLPKEFAPPDPSDTVAYLGQAMAEVRVFDPSLLVDIDVYENLNDAEWAVNPDDPDSVIVYPGFRARGN